MLLLVYHCGLTESHRLQLNYTMQDNSAAGVTVGQVGLDSELIGGPTSSTLTFSLITSRHRPQTSSRRLFDIDPTLGRLYTGSSVDRDVICTGKARCVVELTVQARGNGRSVTMTFVKVVVTVIDENDNRPTFDRSEAEVDVTEAASVGARVAMLPRARDVDSPSNGVQRYFIESPSHSEVFAVDYDDLVANGDVYLISQTRLDREEVDSYSFVLVAVDGGSPALSGSIDIRVRITDVDDNSPVFERSVYHAFVPEDARTGSRITSVRAVDADLGANGEVIYSLVQNRNDDVDQLPFQINSTSGLISTSGRLNYESHSEYTLRIRAASRWGMESGRLALTAHAQVLVHVTDVNDNAPTVVIATIHHGNCSSCSHVVELLPPETFVAHVSVVDFDPVDGRTECQLNDDNFRLEKLFDAEYQVNIIYTDLCHDPELNCLNRRTSTDLINECRFILTFNYQVSCR